MDSSLPAWIPEGTGHVTLLTNASSQTPTPTRRGIRGGLRRPRAGSGRGCPAFRNRPPRSARASLPGSRWSASSWLPAWICRARGQISATMSESRKSVKRSLNLKSLGHGKLVALVAAFLHAVVATGDRNLDPRIDGGRDQRVVAAVGKADHADAVRIDFGALEQHVEAAGDLGDFDGGEAGADQAQCGRRFGCGCRSG